MVQSLYIQATEALGPLLPPDRHDPEHDSVIEGGGNLRCAKNTPRHQQEIHPELGEGGAGQTNKGHCCGIPRVSLNQGLCGEGGRRQCFM